MKRIAAALFCGLLGTAVCNEALPRQKSDSEISTEKLVNTLRLLNTEEYSYIQENHRFADRDQMLGFLRQKGILSRAAIDLENPEPYVLVIATTSDGSHYQIALQRPPDMNDKASWCKIAAFSDDRGVIFTGLALGCEAAPR